MSAISGSISSNGAFNCFIHWNYYYYYYYYYQLTRTIGDPVKPRSQEKMMAYIGASFVFVGQSFMRQRRLSKIKSKWIRRKEKEMSLVQLSHGAKQNNRYHVVIERTAIEVRFDWVPEGGREPTKSNGHCYNCYFFLLGDALSPLLVLRFLFQFY
jgi:hypothetical protein